MMQHVARGVALSIRCIANGSAKSGAGAPDLPVAGAAAHPHRSSRQPERNTMPAISHTNAAKTHRMAADPHQKGDHKAGFEHSEKAMKASETAHETPKGAQANSKEPHTKRAVPAG